MPKTTRIIPVITLPIRLGQFMKLADLVQDGFEAKILIQEGDVLVNGKQETRRGRKLHEGDSVEYAGQIVIVSGSN